MKQLLVRAVIVVSLLWLARHYPPFGSGRMLVEAMNVSVFVIAFLVLDRLVAAKVR